VFKEIQVRMARTKSLSYYSVLVVFLIFGCTTDPKPAPEITGDPELVHSGNDLVLEPDILTEESLYVKNAKPQEWQIALLSAPPGVRLSGSKVQYSIPAGLSGPKEIHAVAYNDSGIVLDLIWTVTFTPTRNLPPSIEFVDFPSWVVPEKKVRLTVRIKDPEGDSLTIIPSLPAGAVYQDSVLEWTPTKEQAGSSELIFNVSDSRRNNAVSHFSLQVLAIDPAPYLADFSVGRTWWIRGYRKMHPEGLDSSYLRREIRIMARDEAAGTFAFDVIDTISRETDSISLHSYEGSYKEGFGFDLNGFSDPNPFSLMYKDPISAKDTILIQGKAYEGVRQTSPNSCLSADQSKYGCGGHDYIFVPGLGRVAQSEIQYSVYVPYLNQENSFEVWAVAGP
jgi:hypothetical protein